MYSALSFTRVLCIPNDFGKHAHSDFTDTFCISDCAIPVFLAWLQPSVGHALKTMDLLFTAAMLDHSSLSKWQKWLRITCKEAVDKWVWGLPDWHLCQPSGVAPAEHSPYKSQTDTNLPEWSYQVLSLHMKSCFPVWSHWNLPFPLKLFLLPFLLRVEGLMEQKRLHCSVVRNHLNNKFNLCLAAMSLHSSPSFFCFTAFFYLLMVVCFQHLIFTRV